MQNCNFSNSTIVIIIIINIVIIIIVCRYLRLKCNLKLIYSVVDFQ